MTEKESYMEYNILHPECKKCCNNIPYDVIVVHQTTSNVAWWYSSNSRWSLLQHMWVSYARK